jgi:DNA-directed RNA polymerase specialized sigma24 family protein
MRHLPDSGESWHIRAASVQWIVQKWANSAIALGATHLPNELDKDTHTVQLSRKIDAAYKAYKAAGPNSEARLYEAFRAQARNVIWWKLKQDNPALEHDIAGRAFMALNKFRGACKASTWFYHIAKNEANRALKHYIEKRKREVPIDPVGEAGDGRPAIEPLARPTSQDAALDVAQLSEGLPREQLEVIARLVEGHTVEEVAKETGVATRDGSEPPPISKGEDD